MDESTQEFLEIFEQSIKKNGFVKLILSKPAKKNCIYTKITVEPIKLKGKIRFNFIYLTNTQTITKNYDSNDILKKVLEDFKSFRNANLFSINGDYSLLLNKKMVSKLLKKKATFEKVKYNTHDRVKKRFIVSDNKYLKELGITTNNGAIAHKMQDKYKQINKYIEVLDSLIKNSYLLGNNEMRIVDMGSGKGYLTFSLYDYLNNILKINSIMTGVEYRQDLVDKCNKIAAICKFDKLDFIKGSINDYQIDKIDILIALHACDTATDDAIAQGIKNGAKIIVTAPCCHKQIRKEFNVNNALSEITSYGILKERQAEMVTDTIRSLILQAFGYKTEVFEFIADAHTHKNVMITAVKKKNESDKKKFFNRIEELKSIFGIKEHYLETLLD